MTGSTAETSPGNLPQGIDAGRRSPVHDPARIQRAIEAEACDALLLKVNQIGTSPKLWLRTSKHGRQVGRSH